MPKTDIHTLKIFSCYYFSNAKMSICALHDFFGAYFPKSQKAEAVYFSRKNITHTGSFTRKSCLLLRKKIAGEKFSGRIFLQKEEERTKEEEKCDYPSKQPMIFRGGG